MAVKASQSRRKNPILVKTSSFMKLAPSPQGICYTSSECLEKGGVSSGPCAAGFGVCCVFALPCSSSSSSAAASSEEVSFLQSEGFPQASTSTLICAFSLAPKDESICQVNVAAATTVAAAAATTTTDIVCACFCSCFGFYCCCTWC